MAAGELWWIYAVFFFKEENKWVTFTGEFGKTYFTKLSSTKNQSLFYFVQRFLAWSLSLFIVLAFSVNVTLSLYTFGIMSIEAAELVKLLTSPAPVLA